jgi:hypothetical protein
VGYAKDFFIEDENLKVRIQRLVLSFLAREGFFLDHVLEGGGALYFFYNSPWWSEDLDFARIESSSLVIERAVNKVEKVLKKLATYLPVIFSEIKQCRIKSQREGSKLYRVFLEADMSEQSKELSLSINLRDFIARKYSLRSFNGSLVLVKEQIDILADKIVLMVVLSSLQGFPRTKDVLHFDYLAYHRRLIYLSEKENVEVLKELVKLKLQDYAISQEEFKKGVLKLRDWITSDTALKELKETFEKYTISKSSLPFADKYCTQALNFLKDNFEIFNSLVENTA